MLQNGPWSFDKNLLVLDRVLGEEQLSDLNMHYEVFWARVYEIPQMLRSKMMARKLVIFEGPLRRWIQNNIIKMLEFEGEISN